MSDKDYNNNTVMVNVRSSFTNRGSEVWTVVEADPDNSIVPEIIPPLLSIDGVGLELDDPMFLHSPNGAPA